MKTIILTTILSLAILSCTSNQSLAQTIGHVTKLPIPRFVSLKSSDVNLRKGPSTTFPIAWKYKCKGYPMLVTAEFEHWRQIEDKDGQRGWVHESFITGTRNVVAIKNTYHTKNTLYAKQKYELIVFRHPDETSYPMFRMQFGSMAKLKKCTNQWCYIKTSAGDGWARKHNLWGVLEHEEIK